jgi:hypothetical protein
MLSKCANPSCLASFRYFHDGKLFRVETAVSGEGESNVMPAGKILRRTEFFWLCDRCASEMTVDYDAKGSVQVRPVARGFPEAS